MKDCKNCESWKLQPSKEPCRTCLEIDNQKEQFWVHDKKCWSAADPKNQCPDCGGDMTNVKTWMSDDIRLFKGEFTQETPGMSSMLKMCPINVQFLWEQDPAYFTICPHCDCAIT